MYMRHNASFAEVMTDLNEYDRVSSDTTCREKPHREWCNERPQRYCVVALFTQQYCYGKCIRASQLGYKLLRFRINPHRVQNVYKVVNLFIASRYYVWRQLNCYCVFRWWCRNKISILFLCFKLQSHVLWSFFFLFDTHLATILTVPHPIKVCAAFARAVLIKWNTPSSWLMANTCLAWSNRKHFQINCGGARKRIVSRDRPAAATKFPSHRSIVPAFAPPISNICT